MLICKEDVLLIKCRISTVIRCPRKLVRWQGDAAEVLLVSLNYADIRAVYKNTRNFKRWRASCRHYALIYAPAFYSRSFLGRWEATDDLRWAAKLAWDAKIPMSCVMMPPHIVFNVKLALVDHAAQRPLHTYYCVVDFRITFFLRNVRIKYLYRC